MRTITIKIACAISAILAAPLAAHAGSQLPPGVTTGIALGAPLPEGVYDITIPTYGWRNTTPQTDVGILAPAWVVWSTPWTILGGHLVIDAVSPVAEVKVHGVLQKGGFISPLVEAGLKWDLGGGFSAGFEAGAWLPVDTQLTPLGAAHDFATFQGLAALSYLKDGWNISTTLIFGSGRNGNVADPGSYAADWLNLDFTGTKKIGKFELGLVAFGSWDLSSSYSGYQQQSQFALGGLLGYDFGPVDVQLKLTRDVYQSNYGGYETRVWSNIIFPIWTAPVTHGAVIAKY